MIEEAEYVVTAFLTTSIQFSSIERETAISGLDAIENAKGTMPDGFWEGLEDEGWSIEFAAAKVV